MSGMSFLALQWKLVRCTVNGNHEILAIIDDSCVVVHEFGFDFVRPVRMARANPRVGYDALGQIGAIKGPRIHHVAICPYALEVRSRELHMGFVWINERPTVSSKYPPSLARVNSEDM